MAQFPINLGGGGGSGSDDCTATAADVRNGKTAIVSGSDDEPVAGTMTEKAAATYYPTGSAQTIAANQFLAGAQTIGAITTANISAANIKYNVNVKVGNASNANAVANVTGTFTSDGTVTAAQIRSGYIGYSKGTKYTGTMAVNSATSFSVAQTANNKVRVSCTTPTAATGRPWGGLYVRGKSGSYPTSVSDGFEVGRVGTTGYVDYTNATNMPSGSTIYFRGWDYVYYNENGSTSSYPLTWYGNSHDIGSVYMGASGYATITSSGTWTLPAGANRVEFFCVGGGGGGGYGGTEAVFSGSGGGYAQLSATQTGTGGSTSFTVTVGSGGAGGTYNRSAGSDGGTSSVTNSFGATIVTAMGGEAGNGGQSPRLGGSGGSGGGRGQTGLGAGGNGGSNGGNGGGASTSTGGEGKVPGSFDFGWGQLYAWPTGYTSRNTTYNGVVYSGGGGGGGYLSQASGGNGGGGKGGHGDPDDSSNKSNPTGGTANTGGGAGGINGDYSSSTVSGGSGVVIAHYWKA